MSVFRACLLGYAVSCIWHKKNPFGGGLFGVGVVAGFWVGFTFFLFPPHLRVSTDVRELPFSKCPKWGFVFFSYPPHVRVLPPNVRKTEMGFRIYRHLMIWTPSQYSLVLPAQAFGLLVGLPFFCKL